MTQEEKDLLLKDLCARLTYGVILHIKYYDISHDNKLKSCDRELGCGNIGYCFNRSHWVEYKPYLRSLSSMTEEEKKEFSRISGFVVFGDDFDNDTDWDAYIDRISFENSLDYLLAHHIDFKGLIQKGLALEAPEDMYNIKNK